MEGQQETLAAWVCTALMRIGTRMATGFDQHFDKLGITQSQFRVLLEVWRHGGKDGIAPSALAEILFIERGTISVITERMVKLGWLERKPGENRRTYLLALTAAGGQMLKTTVPAALSLADDTVAGISDKELRGMRAGLETIEDTLRKLGAPHAAVNQEKR